MQELETKHLSDEQESLGEGYPKLISFTMPARNDNYQQDFKYRITTCLNFLAKNLASIGRLQDVEILVTDWGSETPLSAVLLLSEECAKICRFLYVPENVARGIRPDGGISGTHAFNAPTRRATGKFVAHIPGDCLITASSLMSLFNVLEGKIKCPFDPNSTLFLLHRFNISSAICALRPSLEEWDRYLTIGMGSSLGETPRFSPRFLGKPPRFSHMFQWDGDFMRPPCNISHWLTGDGLANGTTGFLMHSAIWRLCQGLDETFIYYGFSDNDLGLRITQRYDWIDPFGLGVWTYHMDHPTMSPQAINRPPAPNSFQVNNKDWGLGSLHIEPKAGQFSQESDKNVCAQKIGSQSEWINSLGELTSNQKGEIRQHARLSAMGPAISFEEWARLWVICYYSRKIRPRIFLQVGIRNPSYAVAVAQASPIAEIYDIACWGQSSDDSFNSLTNYATAPFRVGYPIHRRIMTGNASEALDRLLESVDDSRYFDLVHANIDFMGHPARKQLGKIVQHLAPHAAIVVNATRSSDVLEILEQVRHDHPQHHVWMSKSGNIGVIETSNIKSMSFEKINDGIEFRELPFGNRPFFLREGLAKKSFRRTLWFIKLPFRLILRWLG
jgi:hypothetical protein